MKNLRKILSVSINLELATMVGINVIACGNATSTKTFGDPRGLTSHVKTMPKGYITKNPEILVDFSSTHNGKNIIYIDVVNSNRQAISKLETFYGLTDDWQSTSTQNGTKVITEISYSFYIDVKKMKFPGTENIISVDVISNLYQLK